MKKTIILFLAIICSGILFGQNLIDTNKIWNVVRCINFGACTTESFKFEGDTLINGTLYKTLMASTDSAMSAWYYYGAFREDASGKVYTNIEAEEVLFYDFDLESGDEFILQFYGMNIPLLVAEVDSVTLMNGEKRKRIIFDDNYGEQWIEGIGSTFGLSFVAYPHYSCDLDHELICFSENGEQKYQNWNYDFCWVTTVGIEESKTEHNWSLVPNPFEETCILKSENMVNKSCEVRIFNLQGMQIDRYQSSLGEMEIGENLNKGFYIFQIIEKGALKQSGKLIKN